jgi:heme oxygenase (mycobilin-producing)
MAITRIGEFRAQAGKDDALRDFLSSVVPTIESSLGCRSCQLLQSHDDPTRFVVVEVWDSIEAHQASVRNIPPGAFENVMKLLAGAPSGEYYHAHHDAGSER